MSTEVEATGVGFGRTAQVGYEELLQRTEQALQAEGFGILMQLAGQRRESEGNTGQYKAQHHGGGCDQVCYPCI